MGNAVREEMNTRNVAVGDIGLSPARLAALVAAISADKVSKQKARDVFRGMLGTEESVDEVIARLGLGQISDDSLLRDAVQKVLKAHPAAVTDVREGKKNSVNFLMGQVMRETKGKANPGVIAKMIAKLTAG